MAVSPRRVWRAAPATLVGVWLFIAVAGVSIPVFAYLIYSLNHTPLVPALMALLTLLTLAYAWRFGVHPRVWATDKDVVIKNPWRTYSFPWADITLIAPGQNGLIISSEQSQVEAWCIQKSNRALKRGRRTRADKITDELLDLLDAYDPPLEDVETGLRIRRARPDEGRLLTRMERAASEAQLGHIFPPEEYPYPTLDVARRWRRLLRDRLTRVHIIELFDAPVGFVAFDHETVRHLGVVPHQTRRGYGSALIEYATTEMFDRGAAAAYLWVLSENQAARGFYHSHHWEDTEQTRECKFPPYPAEIQMVRKNPMPPRRSRAQ